MKNMIIAASMSALLVGATIYLAGCGPASGSSPLVQINSQDVSSNSNDNNSPVGSSQTYSLTVTNENPLVRVSCEGPKMDGAWSGTCASASTQGIFSCPGESSLSLCDKMCFVYGDIEACI